MRAAGNDRCVSGAAARCLIDGPGRFADVEALGLDETRGSCGRFTTPTLPRIGGSPVSGVPAAYNLSGHRRGSVIVVMDEAGW